MLGIVVELMAAEAAPAVVADAPAAAVTAPAAGVVADAACGGAVTEIPMTCSIDSNRLLNRLCVVAGP
jgi:hypothetical protein